MPSTYKNSMCMVLESVLSRMTKDILLLDDIAAEETIQVQSMKHHNGGFWLIFKFLSKFQEMFFFFFFFLGASTFLHSLR